MVRNKKTAEVSKEDLKAMIGSAVKEAMGGTGEEDATDSVGVDMLALVEEALAAAGEKRKSRKDAGEEVGDISSEEILAEVSALLEAEEGKADDEEAEEKADGAEEDEEEKGARKSSATVGRQTKRNVAAPVQRKYADIYLGNGENTQKEQKKMPPAIQLARAIKCLDVFGRHDPDQAAFYAKKHYGDEGMAKEFKALNATSPTSGGYLIPEIYLNEVIELLYAKTVIFGLGARKVPMANGNLNIPKMTTGVRATWGGEQRKIAKTQPDVGNIRLSAKRLEAIVPQTRELLMSTNYSADAIFAQDLTRRMELGLDYGAMFGKGGEFQPLGVANTKGIEVIDATALGNPDLADATGKITADFPVYVRSKVLAKNVDDLGLGWTFNSMLEGYFMNLKTSTGAYIYRDEMNSGKFLGFKYLISNQIPTVANKTDILFGNWADLLVGEQLGLETYTTLEGTWTDQDGVQHSAFEENLTATRALMYVDIAARHEESFAYIKNVKIA